MSEENTTRDLTYGEKAVGVTFNPGGSPAVDALKTEYAYIIDKLVAIRDGSDDPEQKRLASIAITEAQGAQMWAVKAVTWGL